MTDETFTANAARPSGQLEVLKHWQHFYDDGNLILRTQGNTGETGASLEESEPKIVLYRVHKSLLALHSPIFRSMFDASSPSAGDDTYDGVPVVDMPDKAYDVQLLLDGIYAPTYVQLALLLRIFIISITHHSLTELS